MTSNFEFQESNGSPITWSGSLTNLNMGSTDTAELDPGANPVSTGEYSFEKWAVGSWSGTFNEVRDLKFWMSAGTFGTDEQIYWTGSALQSDYNSAPGSPIDTKSSFAVGSIPESKPSSENVTIGGGFSGSLESTGSSDFIVLQHEIGSNASPGPTNTKTLSLEWVEE